MWVRALLSISMWRHFYNKVLARDHVDTMIHEDGRERFDHDMCFKRLPMHYIELNLMFCVTQDLEIRVYHIKN